MIALMYEGVPFIGIIADPFTGRTYVGETESGASFMCVPQGGGAFAEIPLRVSNASTRAQRPIVGYCSWPGAPYNILKACQYLEERGVTMVNMCTIGYFEALVANGEFAGTIFPGEKPWDTAAGHILVSQAGGAVTDLWGNLIDYSSDRIKGHIMSNGHIHDLLVEAVAAAQ